MISLKVLIVCGKFEPSTVTIDFPENKFETEENGIQNEDKNSKMDHPSENIRFIQNIDEIVALVEEILGKSFSVIDY